MSTAKPDTLSRLRAANPVRTQPELSSAPAAQATLQRILSDEPSGSPRPARRIRGRLSRGGVGVVLAALAIGGGAAIAATDPFGWWSANPDTARYAVDPGAHARAPRATQIRCRTSTANHVACAVSGPGQRYTRMGTVELPGPTDVWTRTNMTRAIARAQASHRISRAMAARWRRDLARVPDSFFAKMRLAMRYQTIGAGYQAMGGHTGLVPPPGVPEFVVCQTAAGAIRCQNLNGDAHAPLGAAIYGAEPAPNWRAAPPRRRDPLLPPGLSFTRAEYRFLIDIATAGTTSTSAGSGKASPVPSGG